MTNLHIIKTVGFLMGVGPEQLVLSNANPSSQKKSTRWCQWCSASFPLKSLSVMSHDRVYEGTSKWNQPNMWNSTPPPISICSFRPLGKHVGNSESLEQYQTIPHPRKITCLFTSSLCWLKNPWTRALVGNVKGHYPDTNKTIMKIYLQYEI